MRIIFEDENIALGVDEKNNTPTAIITFTSLFLPNQRVKDDSWNSFSFGFNEKYISTLDINAFYFVSKKNNWYESISLDLALECLFKDAFFLFINTKVLHSTSMGAYGCLKVCNKLSVDYLFLGSPQFSIDNKIALNEKRWSELTSDLTLIHNDAIQNINKFTGKIIIILDPNHFLDMKQLELANLNFAEDIIFLPGAGHMPFQYLMKAGILELCCDLAFSFDDSKFYSIRNVINDFYQKKLDWDLVEKALSLPAYADTCRELALIDSFPPGLRMILIKKALKERPNGPYIKAVYKKLSEKLIK
ncbi:hypothetical protein V6255_14075 [Psychromonas arctica]|uniref:Uncharacterized protein n=2 Tax=Gammaproteobacteria TaxID=1236 RepID=A0ABU9HFB5_9GAMM